MYITRDGEFPLAAGGCADIHYTCRERQSRYEPTMFFHRTTDTLLGHNKSYQGVLHGGQLSQEDKDASETIQSCYIA